MAAESLTDDLLVEILSRVPGRSLCRFKCVSKHWLSLINHPDHRRMLPQTLAGFFYTRYSNYDVPKSSLRFVSASGTRCQLIYPYLAFLPNHQNVHVLDCCHGLLLCCWYDVDNEFHYVVCNPATGQWTVLPDQVYAGNPNIVRLGFDPTVSSHFYVFVLLEHLDITFTLNIGAVDIYSSETGRWALKENRWTQKIRVFVRDADNVIFLNGRLHFQTYGADKSSICIGAMDTHGEAWSTFDIPCNLGFIQQSHGCLHYASFQRGEDGVVVRLVVYALEDYGSKEWVLKHSVETSDIFGATHVTDSHRLAIQHVDTHWMAIHPECNLIFFTAGYATKLMCYDMDRRQANMICSLDSGVPHLPYVPLYAELQSLCT